MDLMLPVAIAISALALVIAIILWLRGRRGRAVQAFGFAVLPVALHLTGLLGLVFKAATALSRWALQLVFFLPVSIGFGLLGFAVVLWIVGGIVARRTPRGTSAAKKKNESGKSVAPRQDRRAVTPAGSTPKAASSGAGDEFDDIEELLRKRGIE